MFFLATVADTIRIAPTHFSGGDDLALIAAINAAYPDRTLMDVGLVVSLYDVLTVGSALIHAGDGAAHFEVVFRVVVFKPFVGECVAAKVTECTQAGIRLSIDFFDNIAVPYYNIFEPNHFDKAKKRWVWDDHQNDEEGAEGEEAKEPEEDSQLEIRKGDFIRFTVESLQFVDKSYSVKGVHTNETSVKGTNNGPPARKRSQSFEGTPSFQDGAVKALTSPNQKNSNCVMNITGSIKQDGLGKSDWWEQEDEEAEAEQGDVDMEDA